ncbi:MAG: hypothetical protein LQ346_008952 [Caloplaca aetnensis]|nr:MAG: hypothetical protein LQ346_008952 [Caloplaca aetnensis]
MRFLSLTTWALAGSFIAPSFAAPAADKALVERQGPSDAPAALAFAQQLYVDIKQYTAIINSTASALTKKKDPASKAKAGKTFTAAIASINNLVVQTTTSIESLPGSPAVVTRRAPLESSNGNNNALEERQLNPLDPTGLATTLTLILLEVGGALNNIIAILGLSKFLHATPPLSWPMDVLAKKWAAHTAATLSFLGPLVASLSLLIASLIPVVDNILALVGALLNGVLGGLSLALAGLVL